MERMRNLPAHGLTSWILATIACLALFHCSGSQVEVGKPEPSVPENQSTLAPVSPEVEAAALVVIKQMIIGAKEVKVVGRDRVPKGWASFDEVGVQVEVSMEKYGPLKAWIFPPDWVGIRLESIFKNDLHTYGCDVYLSEKFKFFACCSIPCQVNSDVGLRKCRREVGPDNPCLQKDERLVIRASKMIEQFCHDPVCRYRAIASLHWQLIPVPALFRECTEGNSEDEKEECVDGLAESAGKEYFLTLESVLTGSSPISAKKAALFSLKRMHIKSSGPAVLEALKKTTNVDLAGNLIWFLEESGYSAAAPTILEWLPKLDQRLWGPLAAKALASFRYQPAIEPIRKVFAIQHVDVDQLAKLVQVNSLPLPSWLPEISLLRLTGTWGEAKNGVRLMLVPPQNGTVSLDSNLLLIAENTLAERVDTYYIDINCCVTVVANDKKYEHGGGFYIGRASFEPMDVLIVVIPLRRFATTPGKYRVHVESSDLKSPEIEIEVQAPKAPGHSP